MQTRILSQNPPSLWLLIFDKKWEMDLIKTHASQDEQYFVTTIIKLHRFCSLLTSSATMF